MRNKVELKKYIFISFCLLVLLTFIFAIVNNYLIMVYRNNYNNKISNVLNLIHKYYPDLNESEIVQILNSKEKISNSFLSDYGIDVDKESVVLINNVKQKEFVIINSLFMFFSFFVILLVFLVYLFRRNRKLREVTNLIEEINKKNYSLNIDDFNEDELSILKSELYKTTIFLKEQADNSINDKILLKDSLEDISHQLKTPLTSILISLDNLIDIENMNEDTKIFFLNKIRREISNINFLVTSLLNLSKLDTNNVKFVNGNCDLYQLLSECIENVSVLSDLKSISIDLLCPEDIVINCDVKWQIEAITNILKNAIEHSNDGCKVKINCEEKKLFVKIVINNKEIIDDEDLPNIFKRFYRGKNIKSNSFGIGLALAKSIIEKNNGRIYVESNSKLGTNFVIKYFKD